MKTLLKTIALSVILLISLTRCSVLDTASLAGHYAGGNVELKSIAYDYETDITAKSELMSLCLAAGEELGYKVEQQTPELISWKVAQSNKVQEYFGKYSQSSLFATVVWNEDKGKQTLRIGSYISGNYSEADKNKVDTLISGFENKLSERLKAGHYYLKKIE